MNTDYKKDYLTIEKKYWWFRARRYWLKTLCTQNNKIIELGAGSAQNIKDLPGKKTALDISSYGKKEAQKNKITYVISKAEKTKFKDNSFDDVIALDVLEHIKNETKAIKEWERIAKKRIILSVPAYQWLWSKHDDINHHVKRYSLRELKQLIKNNTNLKIKRISYWNFFLFPLAVIQKKLTKNAELKLLPKPIN
ncbi:MAG: hypothetical protein CXT77_03480, partial [uncultured DHVE6 group euryarchaeote]